MVRHTCSGDVQLPMSFLKPRRLPLTLTWLHAPVTGGSYVRILLPTLQSDTGFCSEYDNRGMNFKRKRLQLQASSSIAHSHHTSNPMIAPPTVTNRLEKMTNQDIAFLTPTDSFGSLRNKLTLCSGVEYAGGTMDALNCASRSVGVRPSCFRHECQRAQRKMNKSQVTDMFAR